MKNIFYGTVIGIILQTNLYTSQSVKSTEQKEVSVDSKNILKSNIIPIFVGKQFENNFSGLVYAPQILKFDIESEPLKTVIKEQHDREEPCIVARVIVQKTENSKAVRYYIAEGFNQWRFGNSITSESVAAPAKITDPLNGQLKIEFVQYFEYDKESQAFIYRVNSFDLAGSTFYNIYWRAWLNAYQNFNLPDKFEGYTELGETYFLGFHSGKKDYRQAKKIFKIVAEQNINANDQLIAYFRLGLIALSERDYPEAIQYFKQAAATRLSYKGIKEAALSKLGFMYFYGRGVDKDDVKAKEYFDQIVCSQCEPGLMRRVQAMQKQLDFVSRQSNSLNEPLLKNDSTK